jgi:hypothetical protein
MMPRYQPGAMMGPGMMQMSAVAQPMVSRQMVSVTAPPVSSATGKLHGTYIIGYTDLKFCIICCCN